MKFNRQFFIKFLLLIKLTCGITIGFGQYWMYDAGSSVIDEAMDVSKDGAGNFYTTGYFGGSAVFSSSTTLVSSGASDIFLMKTNSAGQFVWAVKAGGFGEDRGLSIKTDLAGNSYITGFYYGTATFSTQTLTSAGGLDAFIAKYNSSGVLQWAVSAGGSASDISNALALDANGNLIITGQFNGTATFGTTTISSQINLQTGLPCTNIFVAKYNNSGNFIWAKQGSSNKDCRGMNLATDISGNIFSIGKFTDTLAFDQTHNNNIYNAIYLLKMDSNGNEQWFKRAGGSLLSTAYGIATDNNQDVIITGESNGALYFFGNPNFILNSTYNYQAFLAKYNGTSGNLAWAVSDGSNSEVSSQVVRTDNSGDIFISGTFKCKFSEYADTLGQGTFNSIGFNDIFVSKFNTAGHRIWMRNFGGKSEDYVHGMVIANNRPVLAGSFMTALVVPSENSSSITINHSSGSLDLPVNVNNNFCSDSYYDSFCSLLSYGNSDIFLIDALNLNRQPYDYYCRDASMAPCDRSYIGCCINTTGREYCSGNTGNSACGSAALYAASNTATGTTTNSCGPNFTYHWSNGGAGNSIQVNASGTYSATVTSEDGCFQSSDTFSVVVHPNPVSPWISDNLGFGTNSPVPYVIDVCADSLKLTGSNTHGCSFHWTGLDFSYINDSIISVHNNGGVYCFTLIDSLGCISQNNVNVVLEKPLPPVDPFLYAWNSIVNDTIYICENGYVRIDAFDSISDPAHMTFCNTLLDPVHGHVSWQISPNVPISGLCKESMKFYPDSSGLYHIDYSLIRINLCDTDTFVAHISYYIYIRPSPAVNVSVTGTIEICPGDSTLLVACCALNYSWTTSGGHIHGALNNDSIMATQPGYYSVSSTVSNPYGCIASASSGVSVHNKPAPNISMNPSNGLICPGGQVTLSTSGGIGYEWYGPSGHLPTNLSSIQVNSTGYYFCIVTFSDSCRISSNTIEVKQYSTPLLVASPNDRLCPGDSILLKLLTNAGSSYQWQAPLSGSGLTQIITHAGTYSCQVTSCGITTTSSVIIQEIPMSVFTSPDTTICAGDTAFLNVQNLISGDVLTYFWTPSSGIISGANTSHPVVKPAVTTSYIVHFQNQNFCKKTDTVIVSLNAVEAHIVSSQDALCHGDCNGSAIVAGTGSLPLQYHWSNNSGNSHVTGLCAGNYTVTVTDHNGCKNNTSVLIHEPALIDISMQVYPTLECSVNCTGQLNPAPSGGTPPYTFLWSNNQSTNILTLLCPGNYSVTVYDAKGCHTYASGLITDLSDLQLSVVNGMDISCHGQCDGFVSATVAGGQSPYTFVWNNTQTSQTISNLCAGDYIVTIADAGNCSRVNHLNINEPHALNPSILLSSTLKCHDDTTSLTAIIPNGFPPYSIQWNDSLHQITQSIHDVKEGTYEVMIRDSHNCLDVASVSILNPPLLLIDTIVKETACSYSCNGKIHLSVAGGIQPYHVVWNDGLNDTLRTGLCEGNYKVTITDNKNCMKYKQIQINSLNFVPPIDATADETVIYRGRTTHLHVNGSENSSILWAPSKWVSDQHSENPETSPRYTTLYQVWTTDSIGCRNTDTITIFVNDIFCREPFIYVPNAFSPNGDGNNDILYVYTNMADELYFVIFDRWGEKIFETTSLNQGWDGTYKGQALEPAVFVYFLKTICLDGEIFEKKGNVTLIR